jgi:hypothetical protein
MNTVDQSGLKWVKEVEEIGNYLNCDIEEMKSKLFPLLENTYYCGASDMLQDVQEAMHNNEPKPGWWSRVYITLRSKYDV